MHRGHMIRTNYNLLQHDSLANIRSWYVEVISTQTRVDSITAFFPQRSRRDFAYKHTDDELQALVEFGRVHSREEWAGQTIRY